MAAGASSLALAGCLGGESGSSTAGGGTATTPSSDSGDSNSDQPFAGKSLTVCAWSGDYAENFKKAVKPVYEERTGATLNVVTGYTEIISKIKSAPKDDPPYDVTITEGFIYNQGISEGLFNEVNYDNVPNIEKVYPYLKEFRTHKYGVPVDGAPIAMQYKKNEIDWEPKAWADLSAHTDVKLGMDGGFYVYSMGLGAIASDEAPGLEELYDESKHQAVVDTLESFGVDTWYSSGAEKWNLWRQGVFNVAQGYFGTSYTRTKDNDNWVVTLPAETTAYFDHFAPVRGNGKQAMAEHFLNFLLDAEVQKRIAQHINNLVSNKGVQYEGRLKEAYPTSNEGHKKIKYPNYKKLSEYSSELSQTFKKLKSS